MPIIPHVPLRRLNQKEFGEIAYATMEQIFRIHDKFGRLFDEKIYKRELARCMESVRLETPIDVILDSFSKRYFLDMLIGDGALFELKTAETLVPRNRTQTTHYLFLGNLAHAKLVNLRPERVEHEFVNTMLTTESRKEFVFRDETFDRTVPGAERFRQILTACLVEWGAGLELALYEDALTHFLRVPFPDIGDIRVISDGVVLGTQKFRFAAPQVAFKLTAFPQDTDAFFLHARRLLSHTELGAILWANITVPTITMATITK